MDRAGRKGARQIVRQAAKRDLKAAGKAGAVDRPPLVKPRVANDTALQPERKKTKSPPNPRTAPKITAQNPKRAQVKETAGAQATPAASPLNRAHAHPRAIAELDKLIAEFTEAESPNGAGNDAAQYDAFLTEMEQDIARKAVPLAGRKGQPPGSVPAPAIQFGAKELAALALQQAGASAETVKACAPACLDVPGLAHDEQDSILRRNPERLALYRAYRYLGCDHKLALAASRGGPLALDLVFDSERRAAIKALYGKNKVPFSPATYPHVDAKGVALTKLGEGSFNTVFLAELPAPGQAGKVKYAVKFVEPDRARNVSAVASGLGQVQHYQEEMMNLACDRLARAMQMGGKLCPRCEMGIINGRLALLMEFKPQGRQVGSFTVNREVEVKGTLAQLLKQMKNAPEREQKLQKKILGIHDFRAVKIKGTADEYRFFVTGSRETDKSVRKSEADAGLRESYADCAYAGAKLFNDRDRNNGNMLVFPTAQGLRAWNIDLDCALGPLRSPERDRALGLESYYVAPPGRFISEQFAGGISEVSDRELDDALAGTVYFPDAIPDGGASAEETAIRDAVLNRVAEMKRDLAEKKVQVYRGDQWMGAEVLDSEHSLLGRHLNFLHPWLLEKNESSEDSEDSED